MKTRLMWVALALAGCANTGSEAADEDTARTGIDAKGQSWTIQLQDETHTKTPITSAMKLISGDYAEYLERDCGLMWRVASCDLYEQTDSGGALRGYLTIMEGEDGSFSFVTETLTAANRECYLSGSLENVEGSPRADFTARSSFSVGSGDDEAYGMIYLERVGNNLRVTDERWNYCYDDRHIDDIYVLRGSMNRQLEPSKWE